MKVRKQPKDPGATGWNRILPPQINYPELDTPQSCDSLIIGAGFCGLAAARRIQQLKPDGHTIIVEARRVARGPAGRNTGFMIDLPHNLASSDYGGNKQHDLNQIKFNRAGITFAAEAAEEYDLPAEAFKKSGKINADYSDFIISKTKDISINADYTNSKIELAENVSFNCDYGNVNIDAANNITGKGDYLTTVIGDLYNDVTLNADYGSIKIKHLTENAGNIKIKSDYVGISIGYANAYNFNFDLKLDYGSLRDDEDLVFVKKIIESTDKYYNGYRGNQTSGNTISIESNYGSVSLKQN